MNVNPALFVEDFVAHKVCDTFPITALAENLDLSPCAPTAAVEVGVAP